MFVLPSYQNSGNLKYRLEGHFIANGLKGAEGVAESRLKQNVHLPRFPSFPFRLVLKDFKIFLMGNEMAMASTIIIYNNKILVCFSKIRKRL